MLAELGVVVSDSGHRLADGAGHSGSSAFGRGRGSSITSPESNRTGELANQEVAFGVSLRGPLAVPGSMRLVDVVVDLGEPSAVGVLGLRVEDLARVAERRARQAARLIARDLDRTDPSRRRRGPTRGTLGPDRRRAGRGIACP